METIIQTIRNEIRKLPLGNGGNQSGIPFVMVYRFTEEKVQMPFVPNPYLRVKEKNSNIAIQGSQQPPVELVVADYSIFEYNYREKQSLTGEYYSLNNFILGFLWRLK